MTTFLKTAAIAALITGFANTAHAGSPYAFQDDDYLAMVAPAAEQTITPATTRSAQAWSTHIGDDEIAELEATFELKATLKTEETIKVAPRIAVARLDGGRLIPTPHGEEFDWKLLNKRTDFDIEVMNAGDYLKYIPEIPFDGVDTDNKIDEVSWDEAKAKALLVNAHTGEVLGAAKTDDITHNIGYLADDMERVLSVLT